MPSFSILVPDAQDDGDGDVERAISGEQVRWQIFRERDPDCIAEEIWRSANAVLAWHTMPLQRATIERLSQCRILVRCGVGYDSIDLEAAGHAGIAVCNVPDYGTAEVADHTLALLLALARGIVPLHEALADDPVSRWREDTAIPLRRLKGLRLGIVGLGRIGTAVALRARAFGFEILAFDPYVPSGHEIAIGAERIDRLDDLLNGSDIVSIHAPLTGETRNLIGRQALGAMRRDALLINTARGPIVDLDALTEALRTGVIAGAALDVLPEEPPCSDHALFAALRGDAPWVRGRLIVTPHRAWKSAAAHLDARRKAVETALAYLREDRLRNCVNSEYLACRQPIAGRVK